MKVILKLEVLLFLLISCTGNTQTEKEILEAREIMTLLYNRESSIRFPPPSIDEMKKGNIKTIEANSTVIDSVKYAMMQECNRQYLGNLPIENIPEEYRKLFNAYNQNKGKCFVNDFEIKDTKGNEIPKVHDDFSNETLKRVKGEHNVLGIVFYSPIIFNSESNKALVCFGATREGLDSHLSIFYFEKIDGEWKIHSSRMLTIS